MSQIKQKTSRSSRLHAPRATVTTDQITRAVHDLSAEERSLLERLLGQSLSNNQRLTIQLLRDGDESVSTNMGVAGNILPHFRIYDGLSRDQTREIDSSIRRPVSFNRGHELALR